MVRPYEVVYIFDSTLEEPAINERLERFHALVKSDGAEAPRLNHWGKRTLAYPIKKREMGYYVVANFQAETDGAPRVRARHQARRWRAALPGGRRRQGLHQSAVSRVTASSRRMRNEAQPQG